MCSWPRSAGHGCGLRGRREHNVSLELPTTLRRIWKLLLEGRLSPTLKPGTSRPGLAHSGRAAYPSWGQNQLRRPCKRSNPRCRSCRLLPSLTRLQQTCLNWVGAATFTATGPRSGPRIPPLHGGGNLVGEPGLDTWTAALDFCQRISVGQSRSTLHTPRLNSATPRQLPPKGEGQPVFHRGGIKPRLHISCSTMQAGNSKTWQVAEVYCAATAYPAPRRGAAK